MKQRESSIHPQLTPGATEHAKDIWQREVASGKDIILDLGIILLAQRTRSQDDPRRGQTLAFLTPWFNCPGSSAGVGGFASVALSSLYYSPRIVLI